MRKNRMLTFMLAIMMMFTLVACSSKELNVVLATDLIIEYGEELDNTKLFDAEKSDKGLIVEKVENYDSKKIGKQDLKITFTDGDKKIEKDVTIEVKDTKKPVIEVSENSITITVGDEPDYTTIIKKVSDPVDGDLKQGKENEKGTYWIDASKLDINTSGEYEIIINAMDINGLTAEPVTIKVSVEDIKKEPTGYQDVEEESKGTDSSANSGSPSNNGGSSSAVVPTPQPDPTPAPAPQPTPQPDPTPAPPVCDITDESYFYTNNSGMVFGSQAEARAWARTQIESWDSQYSGYHYTVFPMGCQGGTSNQQWGIEFERGSDR